MAHTILIYFFKVKINVLMDANISRFTMKNKKINKIKKIK